MSSGSALIVLDLASIADATDMVPPYVETRAIAATVLLDRNHGARDLDPADLHHAGERRAAELRRCRVDMRAANDTYDDPVQATEEAAEAVAFLVARRVLDRVPYARLPTRTGADYRLRLPADLSRDRYERLEVSGIGTGSDTAQQRLREKLERFAKYPNEPPGFAIITNFRDDPITILVGRYEP